MRGLDLPAADIHRRAVATARSPRQEEADLTAQDTAALRRTIAEALDLLQDYPVPSSALLPAEGLASLLDECEALVRAAPGPAPVRLVHHLACTGGTLISRCVAGLPNTVLLSEIDPLGMVPALRPGPEAAVAKLPFRPTDVLLALRGALRPVPDALVCDAFAACVETARDTLARSGQALVLRVHSHSQFCSDVDPAARPTVAEMLGPRCPIRAVVTVRHPLDTFLSLQANNFVHFAPFTLDEFARRHHLFLDRHADVPVVRYEDFVADPERGLERIAGHLGVSHAASALNTFEVVRLSGDSGRTGGPIRQRQRRAVPADVAAEVARSAAYLGLCGRLGYDPTGI